MLQKKTMVQKVQVEDEAKEEEKDHDEVVDVSSLFRQSVIFRYFPFGKDKTIAKQKSQGGYLFRQSFIFTYFLFGSDKTIAKKYRR